MEERWHINADVRFFKESLYDVIEKSSEDESKNNSIESKVEEIRDLIGEIKSYLDKLIDEAIEETDREIDNMIDQSDEEEDAWEEVSESDRFEFHEHYHILSSLAERIRYAIGCFFDVLTEFKEKENPVISQYYKIHHEVGKSPLDVYLEF